MNKPFGFEIDKVYLTEEDIINIYSHSKVAGKNAWCIEEDEERVYGDTWYDNFGMVNYLQSIGIDMSVIVWKY